MHAVHVLQKHSVNRQLTRTVKHLLHVHFNCLTVEDSLERGGIEIMRRSYMFDHISSPETCLECCDSLYSLSSFWYA